jgi:hypothetical protein
MTNLNTTIPKPTPADYEVRRHFEDRLNAESAINEQLEMEYIDFLNSIDWESEIFTEGNYCGLKNALGEIILAPKYDDMAILRGIETSRNDYVSVKKNGKWGVAIADGEGAWIIQPEFDYIGIPNNLTHVYKDGKWGVLNLKEGNFLIPVECDSISHEHGFLFVNGLAIYTKNNKTGVITQSGQFTDAIFDDVEWWEGAVKVLLEGQWGFIDENNQFTTDEEEACYSADY